jgi:hypothetical protein
LFKEIERQKEYGIDSMPYVEYDYSISIYDEHGAAGAGSDEWKKYWHKFFDDKLINKMRKDFTAHGGIAASMEKTVAMLESNGNSAIALSLQDSLNAGNCESGSLSFMKKYGLSDGMTVADILAHKQRDEMFAVFEFRKVVVSAVMKKRGDSYGIAVAA